MGYNAYWGNIGILEQIKSPKDIQKLNINQLEELAKNTRERILSATEKNGGHLASNLGVVELTIALNRLFDFSSDRLVFDVGHQCYAHKILTGRNEQFSSIRLDGGISGFPDSSESVYDAFSTGHAGTSISASLGMCEARDKVGENYYVVNIVGDASIVNGLNLEAINANSTKPRKLIVILNDNGMSISKNKNGFYKFLSKGTIHIGYVKGKRFIRRVFGDSFITNGLAKIKNFIKRMLGKSNYFEINGFKYVGAINGNNLKKLLKTLYKVKNLAKDRAVLLHVKTTKGKGLKKAEENAEIYHGVGKKLLHESGDFAIALGNKLNSLIEKDKKVVAITAGMGDGTGLDLVEKAHPDNYYDVGIAEEFAVTYAGGMAKSGLKPFVAIYSTFMQRAYDQMLHDVCLQNLPVVFCLDRAGLVGNDGKTHQGVFDLSYASHIPNLTILAPTTTSEFEDMIDYAYSLSSPVLIRYPKNASCEREILPIKDGAWEIVRNGDRLTILAVGPRMLELATEYATKTEGVAVINARVIKPLCKEVLDSIETPIITLEENSVIGGFSSLVRDYYANSNKQVKLVSLGVKDQFVGHGSVLSQLKQNGLTLQDIAQADSKLFS